MFKKTTLTNREEILNELVTPVQESKRELIVLIIVCIIFVVMIFPVTQTILQLFLNPGEYIRPKESETPIILVANRVHITEPANQWKYDNTLQQTETAEPIILRTIVRE